jgi:hypothetical protein
MASSSVTLFVALLAATLCATTVYAIGPWDATRFKTGQLYMYTFEEAQNGVSTTQAFDQLSANPLGPLTLSAPAASFSTDKVGLQFKAFTGRQGAGAVSGNMSSAIVNAIRVTNNFAVEMWLIPNGTQNSPSLFSLTDRSPGP